MPETLLAVVGALGLLYLLTVGLAALLGRSWARWLMCAGRWSARSPTPQGCLEPDVKNLYAWCLYSFRLPR
jgi:hypothetical protein